MHDKAALHVGFIAFAFFVLLPAVGSSALLADLSIYFCYALFAVSLALVWGQMGLLSLGHGVFFGVGAYAMSVITLGMVPGLERVHSTWAGVLGAMMASGMVALMAAFLCFSGRGIRGAFLGIVTLALASIAERIATNADWLGGMNGLMGVPPISLSLVGNGHELTDTLAVYWVALGVLGGVVALLLMLTRSRYGAVFNAVRDNELRIWSLGLDVRRTKILVFGLSGAIAGLSGALFVTQFGFASPSLIGSSMSLDVVIWVAIGGRESLIGSALGAITVRCLESRLADYLGDAWLLVLGVLFLLSVIFFPKGFFGSLIEMMDRRAARASVRSPASHSRRQ